MNAIDILGSLLGGGKPASRGNAPQGRGSSNSNPAGGFGGGILDELLKGALGGGASDAAGHSAGSSASSGSRTSSRGSSVNNGPIDIDSEARSLEEMLGVATGNSTRPAPSPNEPSTYRPAPNTRYQPPATSPSSASNRSTPPTANSASSTMTANDEAIFLIQALINAAKADGRIDANEQQTILSQVPNDPATINFLKQQFAQPLDVREFAWSVPLGMEVKVYTMSLAGMQLDNQAEAEYLVELAHGLRLPPDTCRQIHARYGAADIF
ncbi:MAG: DUF533 domain-containing protein [Pirellulales bacterium]